MSTNLSCKSPLTLTGENFEHQLGREQSLLYEQHYLQKRTSIKLRKSKACMLLSGVLQQFFAAVQ